LSPFFVLSLLEEKQSSSPIPLTEASAFASDVYYLSLLEEKQSSSPIPLTEASAFASDLYCFSSIFLIKYNQV